MRPELVVFDMAGTTVYDGDAVHRSLSEALFAADVRVTRDEINEVMGIAKPVAIRSLMERKRADVTEEAVERIHADFLDRMLRYYRTDQAVRAIEGAEQTFSWLHGQGIKVALDTGFSRPIADAILERLGWKDGELLDAVVTSDEVQNGRPAPDLLFEAMRRTGISKARRTAKVGDTPSDLQEGQAAGCGWVIGVTEGSHTREQLAAHAHTHLIGTVAELPDLWRDRILFTPGPLTTSRTVKEAMLRDLGTRDYEFVGLVRRIRERLLALAGLSQAKGYEAILLQGSGTYGVEGVVSSAVPENGSLLVLSNGAYGRRIAAIAGAQGIAHSILSCDEDHALDGRAVREGMRISDTATHVAMVHCETTTGIMNRIQEIAEAVRDAGKTLIVDAMSSFGATEIDMAAWGISWLISSANKCIEGVPGFSFILADRAELLKCEGQARCLSLDLFAQWKTLETEGQFRFTPPTQTLLAFDQALNELDAEGGVRGREARYRDNHAALMAGMSTLGFRSYLAPEVQGHIITAFHNPTHPRFDFEEFYARLNGKGCVVYAGKLSLDATFRIGNIGRIDRSHIATLLDAIRETLDEMQIDRLY